MSALSAVLAPLRRVDARVTVSPAAVRAAASLLLTVAALAAFTVAAFTFAPAAGWAMVGYALLVVDERLPGPRGDRAR